MPKLYIISGCNGAGKTTASYTILPKMLDCHHFLSSDEFAKSLSPFNQEDALITAGRLMFLTIERLFKKKENFSIETTLATKSLIRIIEQAKELGYEVTILYLWLSTPQLAIERVKDRVEAGGHNIPVDTITRRYFKGIYYLFEHYIDLCDKWIIADNSKIPFTIVAEGFNSRTNSVEEANCRVIKDKEKFEAISNLSKLEL